MKPLVLINYPKLDKVGRMAEPGYIVNRKAVPAWTVPYIVHDKRLTNTELAAEFWHSRQMWVNGLYANLHATEVGGYERPYTFKEITRMTLEANIIERFATLPHYDEDNS